VQRATVSERASRRSAPSCSPSPRSAVAAEGASADSHGSRSSGSPLARPSRSEATRPEELRRSPRRRPCHDRDTGSHVSRKKLPHWQPARRWRV